MKNRLGIFLSIIVVIFATGFPTFSQAVNGDEPPLRPCDVGEFSNVLDPCDESFGGNGTGQGGNNNEPPLRPCDEGEFSNILDPCDESAFDRSQLGGNGPAAGGGVQRPTDFKSLVGLFTDLIGTIVVVLFALTFVVFIWGVVKNWMMNTGDAERIQKGKNFVVVGIIAFVVMFSIWGILYLLKDTFLGGA